MNEKNKAVKTKRFTARGCWNFVKELFHPHQVTWPGAKETRNKTLLVLGVTLALALILLAFDTLAGGIFRITTMW